MLSLLSGWLLPARCVLCLAPAAAGLCAGCQLDLPSNGCCCKQCALPLPIATERCGKCLQKRLLVNQLAAPFRYQAPLSELIVAFKKAGNLAAGEALTQLWLRELELRSAQQTLDLPHTLVPVPMHPNRLRQRGFDQAWMFASAIAGRLGIPAQRLLQRVRDTPSQGGLSKPQRLSNVRGAFAVTNRVSVADQHLVLIDDVATTSSTLNACALALRRAGAARVDAWVLARA